MVLKKDNLVNLKKKQHKNKNKQKSIKIKAHRDMNKLSLDFGMTSNRLNSVWLKNIRTKKYL